MKGAAIKYFLTFPDRVFQDRATFAADQGRRQQGRGQGVVGLGQELHQDRRKDQAALRLPGEN